MRTVGRVIGAILLLLWGLYGVVYVGLRLLFRDLTDPGIQGEITGGLICTLILLGQPSYCSCHAARATLPRRTIRPAANGRRGSRKDHRVVMPWTPDSNPTATRSARHLNNLQWNPSPVVGNALRQEVR